MKTSPLGTRMKQYEASSDFILTNRLPVIIRLDGNSFSQFTKRFTKPFDECFHTAMCDATKAALKYCSGAQIGYTQSDEITLLLRNDQQENTDSFLSNRIQKIASLLAATTSVAFNKTLAEKFKVDSDAVFDCRVFVVPPQEVNNVFLWRQRDAFKNCVSSVAYWGLRDLYGRKTAQAMLDGKTTSQRQEIIFQELKINMNDYPCKYKRGICIEKQQIETPIEELLSSEKVARLNKQGEIVTRKIWAVNDNIPLFDKDPNYINKLLV